MMQTIAHIAIVIIFLALAGGALAVIAASMLEKHAQMRAAILGRPYVPTIRQPAQRIIRVVPDRDLRSVVAIRPLMPQPVVA